MELSSCLNNSSKLSFFAWNINGLFSKSFGNNLENNGFLTITNGFDFVILTETWKYTDVEVTGYRSVSQDAIKSKTRGRNSGGIILLYKNVLHDWISIVKSSTNFLWFKINKHYTKATTDMYICGIYIPPSNSNHFNPDILDELENDI